MGRFAALMVRGAFVVTAVVAAVRGPRPPVSGPPIAAAPPVTAAWLWATGKTWAFRAVVVLSVVAVAGGIGVLCGLVPIRASSGHWPVTHWLLDFAKVRAVSSQSLLIEVPRLDDPRLVLMGAGHFEGACRPCHGSPGLAQPRVARAMTPHPPNLVEAVERFDARELFFIVKHGIKFTGMPAWPAQSRDDEVWAVVAFLRTLPEIDARAYGALARGPAPPGATMPLEELVPPPEVPQAVAENCGRCHGVDGRGRGAGAFPVLAGQRPEYLRASLEAYATRERHSGMMEPIAAALDPGDMREIADYYAARAGGKPAGDADAGGAAVARGRTIAHEGIPARLVPACVTCHGPGEHDRNPVYPVLVGQPAPYLYQQLALFKTQARGGTAYRHIMERVANQLPEEDMRAVAAFFASLAPSGARR